MIEGITVTTEVDKVDVVLEDDVVNATLESAEEVVFCNDTERQTNDYAELGNLPKVNGITLKGNQSAEDLGLVKSETGKGLSDLNFTQLLKNAYDAAVTWITDSSKALLDHIGDSVIHLTKAEKQEGALATGNGELKTIKEVADRTDRLLVDFIVPQDATSLTFDRDKNGLLFSNLGLKNILLTYYVKVPVAVNGTMIVRFNNVGTRTYKQTGALTTGFFARTNVESIGYFFTSIVGNMVTTMNATVGSVTDTDVNDIGANFMQLGLNRTVSKIESIQLLGNGSIFSAGSNIKIYRND